MSALIARAENPELFEIFKTYAESRAAAIAGDVIEISGEWAEFTVNDQPQRIYHLGFRYRADASETLINLSVVNNLTVTRPEGTT